jgi:hypothetical protein
MRATLRIGSVQPPVTPIIAELIRRHPGTIRLGQGVVSNGPPAAAPAVVFGASDKATAAEGMSRLVEGLGAIV